MGRLFKALETSIKVSNKQGERTWPFKLRMKCVSRVSNEGSFGDDPS